MNAKIAKVVSKYYQLIANAGLTDYVPIRATGATLPLGGLFDYQWSSGNAWDTPHCGHRDGKTIDFGLGHFQGRNGSLLKEFLEEAIDQAGGLTYGVNEDPTTPAANHWHVHMN